MRNYLKNWSIARIIYLIIAIVVIVQGVQNEDWLWVLLGSFFGLMPIFNVGCCQNQSCSIPNNTAQKNNKTMQND